MPRDRPPSLAGWQAWPEDADCPEDWHTIGIPKAKNRRGQPTNYLMVAERVPTYYVPILLAAPDLLSALEAMWDWQKGIRELMPDDLANKVHSAITKAKGT